MQHLIVTIFVGWALIVTGNNLKPKVLKEFPDHASCEAAKKQEKPEREPRCIEPPPAPKNLRVVP